MSFSYTPPSPMFCEMTWGWNIIKKFGVPLKDLLVEHIQGTCGGSRVDGTVEMGLQISATVSSQTSPA